MNRLLLLLIMLLAVPVLASANPAPVKTAPPPVRPDLLLSVRLRAAALSHQRVVSPGVSVRTPQVVPPALALPPPKSVSVTVAASAQN